MTEHFTREALDDGFDHAPGLEMRCVALDLRANAYRLLNPKDADATIKQIADDLELSASNIDKEVARRAALSRAQAAQPVVAVPDSCLWTPDMDFETDVHYSACGEAWAFNDGGPKENNVRFCQGCGKPVKLAAPQPQQKEEV